MRAMRPSPLALLLALSILASACGSRPDPDPAGRDGRKGGSAEEEHPHVRGKLLLADAGRYHAALTAHLSPKGNKLLIFFETTDEDAAEPVALPLTSFKAYAQKHGDDQ